MNVITTANKAPTLDVITNKRLLLSAGAQTIPLTGISDGGNGTQLLRLSVESTNQSMANVTIEYDDVNHARTGQLRVIPSQLGSTVVTVTVSDAEDDGLIETVDDRKVARTFNLDVVTSLKPWQNPVDPLDVNGDNIVSLNDVLVAINAINRGESGVLPNRTSIAPPYYDVDGNGALEPIDVLILIYAINLSLEDGEGEGSARERVFALATTDPIPLTSEVTSPKDSTDFESELWSDMDWLQLDDEFSSAFGKSRKQNFR